MRKDPGAANNMVLFYMWKKDQWTRGQSTGGWNNPFSFIHSINSCWALTHASYVLGNENGSWHHGVCSSREEVVTWPFCVVIDLPFLSSHCCSVTKSSLTLCNIIDSSTAGTSVLHHLLEIDQIYVHWVSLPPTKCLTNLDRHGIFSLIFILS